MALSKPAEDRLADEEMADIELGQRRDGGDGADRVVGQAMAGMAFEADRRGMGRGGDQPFELALAFRALRLAIGAGMELDHRRAELPRRIELAPDRPR